MINSGTSIRCLADDPTPEARAAIRKICRHAGLKGFDGLVAMKLSLAEEQGVLGVSGPTPADPRDLMTLEEAEVVIGVRDPETFERCGAYREVVL